MKYQAKPVVVEAVQHFGDMGTYTCAIPVWLIEACSTGTIFASGKDTFLLLRCGSMQIFDGDWIVRSARGELSVLKPEIFQLTYEPC